MLSVETYTHCDTPPPPDQLRELLQLCDIFSPNEDEAASIVGEGTPQQLAARLLDAGAAVVLLRCGANGVLLAQRGEPEVWQVCDGCGGFWGRRARREARASPPPSCSCFYIAHSPP